MSESKKLTPSKYPVISIWSPLKNDSIPSLDISFLAHQHPSNESVRSHAHPPEFLTRSFVRNAAENRLKHLNRKLDSKNARPPWRCSNPHKKAHNSCDPPRNQSKGRPMTAISSKSDHAHYLADSAWSGLRMRSASPTIRTAYQSMRGFPLQHDMYNDFIQIPLSGTYRHMEHVYGTDYSSIQARLAHLSKLCNSFKEAYVLPGKMTPAEHHHHPYCSQPPHTHGEDGRSGSTPPRCLTTSDVLSSPQHTVTMTQRSLMAREELAAVSPARSLLDTPISTYTLPYSSTMHPDSKPITLYEDASHPASSTPNSPASTINYHPGLYSEALGTEHGGMYGGQDNTTPRYPAQLTFSPSPHRSSQRVTRVDEAPHLLDSRSSTIEGPHSTQAVYPTRSNTTDAELGSAAVRREGRSGIREPGVSLGPGVMRRLHVTRDNHSPSTDTAQLSTHRTSVYTAIRGSSALKTNRKATTAVAKHRPQVSSLSMRSTSAQHGGSSAHDGDVTSFSEEIAEAGAVVPGHGEDSHGWGEPAWQPPLQLVTPESVGKFSRLERLTRLAHASHDTLPQSALDSASNSYPTAHPNGRLTHRERLQAGIRDLQAEMRRLAEQLGPSLELLSPGRERMAERRAVELFGGSERKAGLWGI
ncbi:hypothetical protein CEUSTIGMA_g3829.t1 [Chlamydomonas eustigma]|uniref:Uncharacterized protein n=1 Tax=Chlamydomonas eustigma TaxID=1157962 RepID=A0A250WZV8_9CHLO|nr:hypothetical protein CEUSTIGMA_g3829.t1 [Chlamydomonas eustigma]|eukprot:GAX76383.1 hypothetical protein CEUSTIGMA_g3829.t1 [Chlamydomonas eustigma]